MIALGRRHWLLQASAATLLLGRGVGAAPLLVAPAAPVPAPMPGMTGTAPALVILGTVNPPSTFIGRSGADGFTVALAALVAARLRGATAGPEDLAGIDIVPFQRALTLAESTPNVLLLGFARTPQRAQFLHFLGPVFVADSALYASKREAARLRAMGAAALHQARVGARRTTAHVEIARRNGYRVTDLPSTNDQALAMLINGRFDLWIDSGDVVQGALQHAGYAADAIEKVSDFGSMDTYFAFSAGTAPATLAAWEAALRAIKKDGSYQRLFHKWRPNLEPSNAVQLHGIRSPSLDLLTRIP